MKKKVWLCLMIGMLLFSTGCMKMEFSMGIHKDKSMDFSIIEAIDMEVMEQFGGANVTTTSNEMTAEEIKEMEEKTGFSVEKYKEDTLEGYKMSKTFSNIDIISTDEKLETDLSSLTETEEENQQLFEVKRGLFKNFYKATLISSDSKEIQNQVNSSKNSGSGLEGFDASTLTSQIDLNFSVSLPYEPISNNATSIDDNGKTLTWNLMEFKDEQIEFEFYLYNTTNIYIALGVTIGFVLILIILVLTTINGNKKRRQKELNESIEFNEQPEIVLPIQDVSVQQYQFNQGMPTISSAELTPNMTSAVEMNPNIQNINNDYYNNGNMQ